MIVLLDANVLVGDASLRKPIWQTLAAAIAARKMRVFVPEIAVLEAEGKFARNRQEIATRITAAGNGASRLVRDHLAVARALAEKEGADYKIGPKLVALGLELLATPAPDHDELARRAILRLRPFDSRGSGYRDSLHWFALLDLIEEFATDDIVFVSDDTTAFHADGAHDQENPVLHPDLQHEASKCLDAGTLTWIRDITKIEVPGRYRGPSFEPDFVDILPAFVLAQCFSTGHNLLAEIDASTLGLGRADSVHAERGYEPALIEAEARQLTEGRELEVHFVVDVEVDIRLEWLEESADGTESDLFSEAVSRTLRLTGTAITEGGGRTLGDVLEVDVAIPPQGTPTSISFTIPREAMNALQESQARANAMVANMANALNNPTFIAALQEVGRQSSAKKLMLPANSPPTGLTARASGIEHDRK